MTWHDMTWHGNPANKSTLWERCENVWLTLRERCQITLYNVILSTPLDVLWTLWSTLLFDVTTTLLQLSRFVENIRYLFSYIKSLQQDTKARVSNNLYYPLFDNIQTFNGYMQVQVTFTSVDRLIAHFGWIISMRLLLKMGYCIAR